MPPPIETVSRQRYTNPDVAGGECAPRGKDVERDFATYHESLTNTLNRALHGTGVAMGFAIDIPGDRTRLIVHPGVALTASGRAVVLADAGPALVGTADTPVPVPVTLDPPAATGQFVLTAAPFLAVQDGDRCGRVALGARLQFAPAAGFAPTPDQVVIAMVAVAQGQFTFVPAPAIWPPPEPIVRRIGESALREQLDALQARFDSTVARLEQRIDELESRLAAHTADRNNPHGTTATQTAALPLTGGTLSGNLIVNGGEPSIKLYSTDFQSGTLEITVREGGPEVVLKDPNHDNTAANLFATGHGGQLTLVGMQGQDGQVWITGPNGRQRMYNTQRPQ